MPRVRAIAVLALVAAGCASTTSSQPAPVTAADFKPEQIRRPVLLVRFVFPPGVEDKDRQTQRADYEGALLDGLNARAVLAPDVQLLPERETRADPETALARARALGADHAIYIQVRVGTLQAVFCGDSRRPFRAQAVAWSQMVSVLRVSDGARRLTVLGPGGGLEVYDVEPDCSNPRDSRRRTPTEAIDEAVAKLLDRVVGP
jgi:hypothetical protein